MTGSVLYVLGPIGAQLGLEVIEFHANVPIELDVGNEDLIQVLWKLSNIMAMICSSSCP